MYCLKPATIQLCLVDNRSMHAKTSIPLPIKQTLIRYNGWESSMFNRMGDFTYKHSNIFSPFLAGTLGGLAIWKSLNMSLISLFSFSPRGSKSTKALLSTFGASLVATGRGGTSGGGLELCCPSGNTPLWNGLPRAR